MSLGGALETLHGFKIGWYVDVGNEMRRLMFTLAHAHGTALALVNIAASPTARNVTGLELRPAVASRLIWAGILFPAGFFLGGIVTYGGDPGLGIWLVPVAALLLFYSVARISLAFVQASNTPVPRKCLDEVGARWQFGNSHRRESWVRRHN